MPSHNIDIFLQRLPKNAVILDYGCFDALLANHCRAHYPTISVDSCDIRNPETPLDASRSFILLDTNDATLPIACNRYDGIVVSHVLEHIPDPIQAFSEILRILKPNGYVYIETPSDRSVHASSHPHFMKHGFFSFWDDPTHIRPWTPAALYRLAVGYGCEVTDAGYIGSIGDKMIYPWIWLTCLIRGDHHRLTDAFWRARKFSCYCIVKKPADYRPGTAFNYITFRKT